MTLSILLFKAWTLIFPNEFFLFGISIILIGILGSYFFWLFIIGFGLNELFTKYGKNKGFRNYKIVLILSFVGIFISTIGSILYLKEFEKQPPELISLALGLLSLYCTIHIVGHLTTDFKKLDKGTEPKLWDYLVTMFLICFFPFGLMIMHAHLRLLQKDKIKGTVKTEEITNANTR